MTHMNLCDRHLALHLIVVDMGGVDWKASIEVSDNYAIHNECDGWSRISIWTQSFNFHKIFSTHKFTAACFQLVWILCVYLQPVHLGLFRSLTHDQHRVLLILISSTQQLQKLFEYACRVFTHFVENKSMMKYCSLSAVHDMYLTSTNEDHIVTNNERRVLWYGRYSARCPGRDEPWRGIRGPPSASCAGWPLKIAPQAWWLTQS